MITINFYKDGTYITGHSDANICWLVSYAIWACIQDCLNVDTDIWHYESGFDDDHRDLGFSYFKINLNNPEHRRLYQRYRSNQIQYVTRWRDKVKINLRIDELIEYDYALKDVKLIYNQNMGI